MISFNKGDDIPDFSYIIGDIRSSANPPRTTLTAIGEIINSKIIEIDQMPEFEIPNHVIMPDHIHLRQSPPPTDRHDPPGIIQQSPSSPNPRQGNGLLRQFPTVEASCDSGGCSQQQIYGCRETILRIRMGRSYPNARRPYLSVHKRSGKGSDAQRNRIRSKHNPHNPRWHRPQIQAFRPGILPLCPRPLPPHRTAPPIRPHRCHQKRLLPLPKQSSLLDSLPPRRAHDPHPKKRLTSSP